MEVKKAGIEYIPQIQALAHITWNTVYRDILSPGQLAYMLQLIYSTDSLQNQMISLGHQFIVVAEEEKTLGFASYSAKHTNDTTIYRLHKIYITPDQQGRGTGKKLLEFITRDISKAGARILELNVNRNNKALGFYEKLGFKIIGEEDIPIGNGYFMNDYILQLILL